MASFRTIFAFAGIFYVAMLFFGGWAVVLFLLAPHFAIPIALVAGTIAYAIFDVMGRILNWMGRLTFLNQMSACAVASFALGFLPWRVISARHPGPADILLEDYAMGMVFYATLLYLMCPIWWASYQSRKAPSR